MGDLGSIPRLGRSPGEGNSYPLQYPVLKNSDRGAWWAQSMGSQSVRCSWSDTAERLSLTNGSLLFKANCAAPPSSNIVLSFLALHIYGTLKDGNNNPEYEKEKETLMYRRVLWTLWEREKVGRFGRMALKHVKYHV